MNSRRKVLDFLTLNEYWNPQLMFVMGVGVALNFIFFYYIINKVKIPLLADKMQIPINNEVDKEVNVGISYIWIRIRELVVYALDLV